MRNDPRAVALMGPDPSNMNHVQDDDDNSTVVTRLTKKVQSFRGEAISLSGYSTETLAANAALKHYEDEYSVVGGPSPLPRKAARDLAQANQAAYRKQVDNGRKQDKLQAEINKAKKKMKIVMVAIVAVGLLALCFLLLAFNS